MAMNSRGSMIILGLGCSLVSIVLGRVVCWAAKVADASIHGHASSLIAYPVSIVFRTKLEKSPLISDESTSDWGRVPGV